MSENEQQEAAPVRVPNVSPGARSGIDHQVIGSNAQEAYEANQAIAASEDPDAGTSDPGTTESPTEGEAPEVPADLDSEGLLAWVSDVETSDEQDARVRAVLAAEQEKADEDRDADLVTALESHLAAVEADGDNPPA